MIMTEGKQQKQPPYGDFMRITRKGLSWAENLCQQVEELCPVDDFVKNPSRCVDAVGEHLKKMLDNLIHDMENEIDDEHDVTPFSDISLGHGAMLEDFERKRTKLDGIALDEELSPCEDMKLATSVEDLSLKHENVIDIMKNNAIIENLDSSEVDKSFYSEDDSPWEDEDFTKVSNISGFDLKENVADKNFNCDEQNPNVYFVEDPNQATFSYEHKLLSDKDTPNKFKGTLTAEGEGLNCSVSRGKSYESFYDEIIAYQMESVSSSSQSLSSISDESILPGSQSSFQLVFVDPKHQEKLFSLETCESGHSPQKEPEKLKTRVTSRNCENLNIFSREEEFSNHSFSFVEADDTNDFEYVEPANDFAVKIEGSWDEILRHEISLISSQVDKRLSCKKILKRMLSSRLRLSSDSKLEKYHDDLQSQASLGPDWELL